MWPSLLFANNKLCWMVIMIVQQGIHKGMSKYFKSATQQIGGYNMKKKDAQPALRPTSTLRLPFKKSSRFPLYVRPSGNYCFRYDKQTCALVQSCLTIENGNKDTAGNPLAMVGGGREHVLTPFDIGIDSAFPSEQQTRATKKFLLNTAFDKETLNRNWVQFGNPSNAEATGVDIVEHFVNSRPYTDKLMGCILALFKELDDKLYNGTSGARWRMFIDPKVTMSCMNSEQEREYGDIVPLMTLAYIYTHSAASTMCIMALLVDYNWVCFIVNKKNQTVTAFQPVCSKSVRYIGKERLQSISQQILITMMPLLAGGSPMKYSPPSRWSFELYEWGTSQTAVDEEGAMVAMFGYFFDGYTVMANMSKATSRLELNAAPVEDAHIPFKWTLCTLLLERGDNPENPVGLYLLKSDRDARRHPAA